jgi:hypothetical protein
VGVRSTLNTERGVVPSAASTASEECPIGNKKAKEVLATAAHSKSVQSAVDKCLVEVTTGDEGMTPRSSILAYLVPAKEEARSKDT